MDREWFVGRMLPGGYRVGRFVASGGFAWVYEGSTPRRERCAIKIPFQGVDQAHKRFLREIKVLRSLPTNEHCVRYFGDGWTEERLPFLAMEFVDGITLSDALRRRPVWRIEDACRLMIELCRAYADQHELGLANRDVKPDNVMLTRDVRVKVLDLGLVKDAQGLLKLFEDEDILEGSDFAENLDRGVIAGSPDYMAPEQFADSGLDDPDEAKTDTWTDVYSLALIFYQLLTGRKLFQFQPSSMSGTPAYARELMAYVQLRMHRSESHVIRPGEIDEALWPVFERALKSDPRRRYRTATELGLDVESYLETGEVPQRHDEVTYIADVSAFLAMHRGGTGSTRISPEDEAARASLKERSSPKISPPKEETPHSFEIVFADFAAEEATESVDRSPLGSPGYAAVGEPPSGYGHVLGEPPRARREPQPPPPYVPEHDELAREVSRGAGDPPTDPLKPFEPLYEADPATSLYDGHRARAAAKPPAERPPPKKSRRAAVLVTFSLAFLILLAAAAAVAGYYLDFWRI
jgi:serine/threonine protein kinase